MELFRSHIAVTLGGLCAKHIKLRGVHEHGKFYINITKLSEVSAKHTIEVDSNCECEKTPTVEVDS